MFENYSDIIGIKELCQMLHIGKNTAYGLLERKEIKHARLGKMYKISKYAVIEYFDKMCEQTTSM